MKDIQAINFTWTNHLDLITLNTLTNSPKNEYKIIVNKCFVKNDLSLSIPHKTITCKFTYHVFSL